MSETAPNRRLAAILATDVVGYSKLMGADETGTLTALKRHREAVFQPSVTRHNGRTFKLMGDGTLVEFASVVDAVKCALDIQSTIAAQTPEDSDGPRIVLRIGVNLGDVIIDDEDVYGDGVNVAARLEPLAEVGGICVSSIVNESVGGRINIAFADGGEVQVKNIQRPIRIWKWAPNGSGTIISAAAEASADGWDGRKSTAEAASIAVLPFDNMSGDPEQEYFSDGISEDIITDLSKVGGLLVIARNSSFAYKGKSVDIRAVVRELGASSILEGSIRRAGNRVRINAQLIDASSGGHLWADRYDRDLTDIFEVQDEVTREIVGALKVALTPAEEARITNAATGNPEAHDALLRGREILTAGLSDADALHEVVQLLNHAIELDPHYAEPYAGLAMAYNFDHLNQWSDAHEDSATRARENAEKAGALDPDNPSAHYALSIVFGVAGDHDKARIETEAALRLNPSFAPAHASRGVFEIFGGDPAGAIPHIEKALRLDPTHGQQSLHFLGLAHLLLGNYETAAATFRERILQFPATDLSRSMLASTLGHLGEIDEAKRVWRELKSLNPDYSFDRHMGNLSFANTAHKDVIADGLSKAGLPD